jgi:AhpD family alkylhydroperoxidase
MTTRRVFRRRIYRSPAALVADFRYMLAHRALIRRAMRQLISPAFRERLMMVVTEVNGCRYCSYYHAREALKSGISAVELAALLAGQIPADAPAGEHVALAYAQHWAETDAHPDPEAAQKLIATYGEERAAAIDIILRMIRIGNLLGNTADYLLYWLSFGRLGMRENEAQFSATGLSR